MPLNGAPLDEVSQRLLAAKHEEMWQPHPMIRRMLNSKGEERLQQLWVSSFNKLEFRDVPLFNPKGEYINEGDTAINTGPIARVEPIKQAGELPEVPSK